MKRIIKQLLVVMMCFAMLLSVCACSTPPSNTAASENAAPAQQGAAEPNDSAAAPESAPGKDTLTVVISTDIGSFNPAGATSFPHVQTIRQIFETLVYRDANMEIQPWLAESWEWVSNTELNMKIRQGVSFSNGTELKASDVLFTFKYIMENQNGGIDYVRKIDLDKTTCTDDYTLNIILSEPTPNLIELLENPMVGIMCESAVAEGETFTTVESAIGTGPYIATEYNLGDSLKMVANPNYWNKDAMPKVQNILFRIVSESSSRTTEALSGNVDIVYDLPAADVEMLSSDDSINYMQTTTGGTVFFCLNSAVAPLDNAIVREAIWYGIDRETVVMAAYKGYGAVQPNIFADGVDGAIDTTAYNVERDVEKAKSLLAEAGYPNGIDLSVTVFNTDQNRMDMAEAIQAQLAEVGINLDVQIEPQASAMQKVLNGQHQCCIYGFTATTFEAGRQLIRWLPGSTDFKVFGWNNEEYNTIVNSAMSTVDQAARYEQFAEAEKLLVESRVAMPMWNMTINAVLQKDVSGFYFMRTFQHHLLQFVYFD